MTNHDWYAVQGDQRYALLNPVLCQHCEVPLFVGLAVVERADRAPGDPVGEPTLVNFVCPKCRAVIPLFAGLVLTSEHVVMKRIREYYRAWRRERSHERPKMEGRRTSGRRQAGRPAHPRHG